MDGWIADGAAIAANGISILTVILIMQLFFGVRNCRKWWHYLILTGIAIVWNTVCVLIFREADNWQFAGMLVLIAAAGERGIFVTGGRNPGFTRVSEAWS